MAQKSITGDSYTNENIQSLQKQIDQANESLKTYNTGAATEETLRQQAKNEYTPLYNAQVQEQEALKNSAQTALNDQLSALDRQYSRDAETLGRNYDAQRVAANNTMLARGLNNSSLAAAMLNLVETERGRALQNLSENRAAGETSARGAYNDAISAADKAIGRLGTDLQSNIDARYQALRDADAERVFRAQQAQNQLTQYVNELMLQIEQLRQQGYSQYLQEQQWQKEFDFQQKQYEDSRKSSGSSSGASSTQPVNTNQPSSSLEDKYNNSGDQKTGKPIATTVSDMLNKLNNGITSAASLLSSIAGKAAPKKKISENAYLYEDGSMRPAGHDS